MSADVKLCNQDGENANVINSHLCHYFRLWNNAPQFSSFTHSISVNVGGRAAPKKKRSLQIPCHSESRISLIPTASLSLSPTHCLFLTSRPRPTPFHSLPSFLLHFSISCWENDSFSLRRLLPGPSVCWRWMNWGQLRSTFLFFFLVAGGGGGRKALSYSLPLMFLMSPGLSRDHVHDLSSHLPPSPTESN